MQSRKLSAPKSLSLVEVKYMSRQMANKITKQKLTNGEKLQARPVVCSFLVANIYMAKGKHTHPTIKEKTTDAADGCPHLHAFPLYKQAKASA